ncbi:MAG: hypothetical protein AAFQ45_08970 [Pseudomonadota bacterium]
MTASLKPHVLRCWLLAAIAAAGLTFAVGKAPAQPSGPTYDCMFEKGQVNSFEEGQFAGAATALLKFSIGAIDLKRQTATLSTESGSGTLRIVRAISANHYLEVITEGFLNVTTIYEPSERGAPSPAVHSRHVGLLGQPMSAHYTGFCTPRAN